MEWILSVVMMKVDGVVDGEIGGRGGMMLDVIKRKKKRGSLYIGCWDK